MTERLVVRGPGGTRMMVIVVRPHRFRRARIVRAMARNGFPPFAIAGALGLRRSTVERALAGNDVFTAAELAVFREGIAA